MNNKGFVFVETIVTITILLVALMVVYVSYSNFIVGEKRRLYYDDMSYVSKTMTVRDVMYSEQVFFNTGTSYSSININVDALKQWAILNKRNNNLDYYLIAKGQTMFKPDTEEGLLTREFGISSDKFQNIMDTYHIKYLIYIPNVKLFKENVNNINDLATAKQMPYLRNYLSKLSIPCESDNKCNSYYNGVIISIVNEYRDGSRRNSSESYSSCMADGTKSTMACQEANYLSWVYA